MNIEPSELAFMAVLILSRVGTCMMLLPGFSSGRLPMRVRSLLAVAVSLALFPLLFDGLQTVLKNLDEAGKIRLLVVEIIVGATFGLLARLFMVGLQFSAVILTATIGLAPTPGTPVDDTEAASPVVSFISLCGTMMIFTTNTHLLLLQAILKSYDVVKPGAALDIGWHVDQLVRRLAETSELGLRLCSPFVVYSIIVNLAIGFVNKFTPQISVYFITTGMVAAGGLFLLYFSIDDWLSQFQFEFQSQFK